MRTEEVTGIVLAQGAARAGVAAVRDCVPYENEKMAARRQALPFLPVSAVVALFPLDCADGEHEESSLSDGKRVAMYARGGGYVAGNKARLTRAAEILHALQPAHRFHPSGNGWPLPAVQAARLAGLGDIGLHGLLIAPGYGSMVTIGAILTDLPLTESAPGGYCELCGACVDACPTGAILWDGVTRRFDKRRCRSYLSQQKELSPEQEALLRGSPYVRGCDDCQNICPHNIGS